MASAAHDPATLSADTQTASAAETPTSQAATLQDANTTPSRGAELSGSDSDGASGGVDGALRRVDTGPAAVPVQSQEGEAIEAAGADIIEHDGNSDGGAAGAGSGVGGFVEVMKHRGSDADSVQSKSIDGGGAADGGAGAGAIDDADDVLPGAGGAGGDSVVSDPYDVISPEEASTMIVTAPNSTALLKVIGELSLALPGNPLEMQPSLRSASFFTLLNSGSFDVSQLPTPIAEHDKNSGDEALPPPTPPLLSSHSVTDTKPRLLDLEAFTPLCEAAKVWRGQHDNDEWTESVAHEFGIVLKRLTILRKHAAQASDSSRRSSGSSEASAFGVHKSHHHHGSNSSSSSKQAATGSRPGGVDTAAIQLQLRGRAHSLSGPAAPTITADGSPVSTVEGGGASEAGSVAGVERPPQAGEQAPAPAGESRWRRRRALALIREQREAGSYWEKARKALQIF